MIHLAPDEGKTLDIDQFHFVFKAGTTTGSPYTLAEVHVPPGVSNAVHRHGCEETMVVLAGELEFVDGAGCTTRVRAGDAIHVPSHTPHGYTNVGSSHARLLVVAPVAQEALFDGLANGRS
jgi:quercetin dioxygenase-like cupin family protein